MRRVPLARTTGRLDAGARAVVDFCFRFRWRRNGSRSLTARPATKRKLVA
jgi:hypothetical protein